jgi:hypothetical protein
VMIDSTSDTLLPTNDQSVQWSERVILDSYSTMMSLLSSVLSINRTLPVDVTTELIEAFPSHLPNLLHDLRKHAHVIDLLTALIGYEAEKGNFGSLRALSLPHRINMLKWIVSHLSRGKKKKSTNIYGEWRLFHNMPGKHELNINELYEANELQVKVE